MNDTSIPVTFVERVYAFNHSVVNIGRRERKPLEPDELKWLLTALNEELEELVMAPDLVDQVDALADLIVFATGGFFRAGLRPTQVHRVLSAVMDCNFEKKSGLKPGRDGAPDAYKPEGWTGPETRIQEIINE